VVPSCKGEFLDFKRKNERKRVGRTRKLRGQKGNRKGSLLMLIKTERHNKKRGGEQGGKEKVRDDSDIGSGSTPVQAKDLLNRLTTNADKRAKGTRSLGSHHKKGIKKKKRLGLGFV